MHSYWIILGELKHMMIMTSHSALLSAAFSLILKNLMFSIAVECHNQNPSCHHLLWCYLRNLSWFQLSLKALLRPLLFCFWSSTERWGANFATSRLMPQNISQNVLARSWPDSERSIFSKSCFQKQKCLCCRLSSFERKFCTAELLHDQVHLKKTKTLR